MCNSLQSVYQKPNSLNSVLFCLHSSKSFLVTDTMPGGGDWFATLRHDRPVAVTKKKHISMVYSVYIEWNRNLMCNSGSLEGESWEILFRNLVALREDKGW